MNKFFIGIGILLIFVSICLIKIKGNSVITACPG